MTVLVRKRPQALAGATPPPPPPPAVVVPVAVLRALPASIAEGDNVPGYVELEYPLGHAQAGEPFIATQAVPFTYAITGDTTGGVGASDAADFTAVSGSGTVTVGQSSSPRFGGAVSDDTVAEPVNGYRLEVTLGVAAGIAVAGTLARVGVIAVSDQPVTPPVTPPPTDDPQWAPQRATLPDTTYDPTVPAYTLTLDLALGSGDRTNDLQALCEQARGSGHQSVRIRLPVGVTRISQVLLWDKYNGTLWVTFESAGYGTTFTKVRGQRAFATDPGLAIVEHSYAGGEAGFSSPYDNALGGGSVKWRWRGIHFRPALSAIQTSNANYAAPTIRAGNSDKPQGDATGSWMPDEWVFYHCVWTQPDLQTPENPTYLGMACAIWWHGKRVGVYDCDAERLGSNTGDQGFFFSNDAVGPITIDNCGVESSNIGIYTGGSPAYTGPSPSNFTLTRSWVRPPAQRAHRIFKGNVEFKAIIKAKVADCIIENAYNAGQAGHNLIAKSSCEYVGALMYSSDLTVQHCKLLNGGIPFLLSGLEGDTVTHPTNAARVRGFKRIDVVNCMVEVGRSEDIDYLPQGGNDGLEIAVRGDVLASAQAQNNPTRYVGGALFRRTSFVRRTNADGSNPLMRSQLFIGGFTESSTQPLNGFGLTSDAPNQSLGSAGVTFEDCWFGAATKMTHGDAGAVQHHVRVRASNTNLIRTVFFGSSAAVVAGFATLAADYTQQVGTTLNYFPTDSDTDHLVDKAVRNYRFKTTSPYYNKGLGCDHDVLDARTAHCRDGQWV